MTNKIPVLDGAGHVELLDHMGSDLNVVNAARVSFDKQSEWEYHWLDDDEVYGGDYPIQEKRLSKRDAKLIAFLARHNHWTPFAHTSLTFRIKAPLFVARQLGKHQVGLVWNEVSRRYVDSTPEFYVPKVWHKRAENVKQGSSDETLMSGWSPRSLVEAVKDYEYLLDQGAAPEEARMVLPQNMMTEWWWTGSLAAFARVCGQRLDSHAQRHTREYAEAIARLIPHDMQYSWLALLGAEYSESLTTDREAA